MVSFYSIKVILLLYSLLALNSLLVAELMARLLFGRRKIGQNFIFLEVISSVHYILFIRASVTSICVHPSNKVALSIGADNTMRMWNLIKGRLGYVRKLKEQAFKILFSPDGSE